ncbi:MAG: DUF4830 domain-containing protein [Oscillibacter sp.]|nr:DUF4830 domain-containing protein [Oscillibacter sp.]
MFIWTAKFPALKTLIVLLAAAMAALAFLILRVPPVAPEENARVLESNADRVGYLRELGWEVEEEPVETYEFLLPETLTEPYLSYNALQLPQGFDLGPYCGRNVSRYTYAVTNHPDRDRGVQANLYLCDGVPVAGDIFCPGANGFQEALVQAPRQN